MKGRIKEKKEIFRNYLKNGRPTSDYENKQTIRTNLTETIISYYSHYERLANKLNDPTSSSKSYWSVSKTLVSDKNIPVMPEILVSNKIASNFRGKAIIFNDIINKHCNLNIKQYHPPINQTFETINRLSSIDKVRRKF